MRADRYDVPYNNSVRALKNNIGYVALNPCT
jgi:hypothetical protein